MSGKQISSFVDGVQWDVGRTSSRPRPHPKTQAKDDADEPRRSGRATKGQHKNASSSPAPVVKAAGPKTAKSKPPKKSLDPEPPEGDEDDEEEKIRCICGNDNPKDKRAFIGCDACTVWQHNVCMGMSDDHDDVPDHYFCEQCRPEEHEETIQAMERGEKIWETRTRIYQNEKKMSKSRKSKPDFRPAWLRKEVPTDSGTAVAASTPPAAQQSPAPAPATETAPAAATNGSQETSNKRKRDEEVKDGGQPPVQNDKPVRPGRQDKRRKSSTIDSKVLEDTDTALVDMDQLPKDRQSVAQALGKIISADLEKRVKSGLELPADQTPAKIAEHHALRIEYALHMNIGAGQPNYKQQFMALNANLKKNAVLIERLLDASLTADELSTMSSSDMASEELQRQRAQMKEALDRQAIAVEAEGPKYKQDHKGFHLIEDASDAGRNEPPPEQPPAKPVDTRDSVNVPAKSGSPLQSNPPPLTVDTKSPDGGHERRPSSSQFDMNNIWAKTGTAQSPTSSTPAGARPVQAPIRRSSSMQNQPQNGTKDDADVDRLLDDDDDSYTPADAFGDDTVVWQGKLVQTSEEEAPVVNARFVAGRDLQPTISWRRLLPDRLSIDGRLAIDKAEAYLCGLRWSSTSDVSVLALTAHNDAAAFEQVFKYFKTRERYAVVEKDKATMIKDLYIVPVDVGAEKLPDHIGMLEHCTIKTPVEEKLLLATFVVARSPESPAVPQDGTPSHLPAANGNGHLPQHIRQSVGGPAGSPLNPSNPTFSPANSAPPPSPYGPASGANAFPPNPYGPSQTAPVSQAPGYPPTAQQPGPYPPPQIPGMAPVLNPQVIEILGPELVDAPTAQLILREAPNLNKDQLVNLRTILTEDHNARTDFGALTKKLFPPE